MSELVQKPAVAGKPSPFEIEMKWYREVYRGDDMKQLTLRAVLMGGFLGCLMSLVNIYVGLKTGWGLGVAITACILSFSIWKVLRVFSEAWMGLCRNLGLPAWVARLGFARSDMTILENNCMQSTASSAGYSTGGTMVSAIAAWMLINDQSMGTGLLMIWVFFLAVLGVTLAIPMKRQMINIEQLKFPSGIAAAETLKSLHGTGEGATRSAASLGVAAALGGLIAIVRDILGWIPAIIPAFGARAAKWTVAFEPSALMVAAGAIMGLHTATSMLIGAVLCWAVLVPIMHDQGVIAVLEYKEMVQWTLWGGVSCMVTSGLLNFGMQWRTALRAFSGLRSIFSKAAPVDEDPLARIEVPGSWFLAGTIVGTIGVVTIAYLAFDMPIWMGLLGVVMSFFLALVACRATGETDTTPVGAMGKVTQLFYGAITPRSFAGPVRKNVNLMAACITAGVADSSADLLIDLKSGYMLGANARKQFIAQFSGIFFGTVFAVGAFQIIVPTAAHLGTDKFPAPAAQTWRGVAELLSAGLHSIHPTAQWALVIGGALGIALPLIAKALPEKWKWVVPSPMGLGMAFTFHFFYAFNMFLGALAAYALSRWKPKLGEDFTIPVASGFIAGESLVGVGIALVYALGWVG
jgi:uncharacterized oligopeptide transporter (OPT) family protein